MRVLFVYKGNGQKLRNSIIDAQIDSLKNYDFEIVKFPLKTSGIPSYFTEFIRLMKFLKNEKIDFIHAHYSYSGIISGATGKKTICSLMGSDIFNEFWFVKPITFLFYRFIWLKTIVKSKSMQVRFPNSVVIANGVDFNNFSIIKKEIAIIKTNLCMNKKNVIFVAEDINRKVKNYNLASTAIKLLSDDYVLTELSGLTHKQLVYYYNAADVLLLTSLSEGSPNVIKEAMACNCPIVSTDVGDVKENIYNTEGCFISSYDPSDIANKIQKASNYGKSRTNGRENITHLNNNIIAKQILNIYNEAVLKL